jgi:hypothetical protein
MSDDELVCTICETEIEADDPDAIAGFFAFDIPVLFCCVCHAAMIQMVMSRCARCIDDLGDLPPPSMN